MRSACRASRGASSPEAGKEGSDTMARPWMKRTNAMEADRATAGETDRARTGRAGEALAQRYLEARGLRVLERNYRVGRGGSSLGGEIDLILLDTDGEVVC